MVSITDEFLDGLTRKLVDHLHPVQVFAFGSRIDGHPHHDSDLDIMIILPDHGGRRVDSARLARRLLRDAPVPVDVLVRFQGEFRERAAWPTTMESVVMRKGRLLFG